jgi:hypothetical protein
MPQNCNFECSNGECCFEEAACGTPGCNERRRFCKIYRPDLSSCDLMTNVVKGLASLRWLTRSLSNFVLCCGNVPTTLVLLRQEISLLHRLMIIDDSFCWRNSLGQVLKEEYKRQYMSWSERNVKLNSNYLRTLLYVKLVTIWAYDIIVTESSTAIYSKFLCWLLLIFPVIVDALSQEL